jgi:exopolysaccharide biosynthesis polyprenyl glycosylphosphotransferase
MSVATTQPQTVAAPVTAVRRTRGRAMLLAGGDLVALAVAYGLMRLVTGTVVISTTSVPVGVALALAVAAIPVSVALFAAYGLYDTDQRRIAVTSFDEATSIFHALLVGSVGLLVLDQLLRRVSDWRVSSAVQAVVFVGVGLVAVIVARGALRSWVFPRIFRRRRALVVGTGPDAEFFQRTVAAHPEFGFDVVAVLPDTHSPAELQDAVVRLEADRVVLTSSSTSHEETLELARSVRQPYLQVSIIPRYHELFTANATLEDLAGAPIVTLPGTSLRRSAWVVKRGFDIIVSGAMLLLLSPLLLAVAVAIRLDSPGPSFYRQARRGRNGSTFMIVKFRSMFVDAEQRRGEVLHLNEVDGPLFKIKGRDPRVTRLGGVLRRWSIDELPQLWNVLRGDMSLVGPRPFVVYEADRITGWALRRLDTTPGITGPWQVLGRNDLAFEEMAKLDYLYATNWSLWWDLRILYQTALVVLQRKGAY